MTQQRNLFYENPSAQRVQIPTNIEQARAYYLGFGKFNGQSITSVPVWYLRWLAGPKSVGMPAVARAAARILLEAE